MVSWRRVSLVIVLLFLSHANALNNELETQQDTEQQNSTAANSTQCGNDGLGAAEDKCAYALACPDEDSMVNWQEMHYCTFKNAKWFSVVIMVLVLAFLFYLLGQTSNRFFIPTLEKLSDILRLTPSIAGVTLLAFGNGAADIFTNFAVVNDNLYEQSFGQLLGAALFVILVVVGGVSVVSNATINRRPFLRDVGFLTLSIAAVFLFLFDYKIELWEALLCLGIYVVFVLVVVIGRIVYQRSKVKRKREDVELEQKRLLDAGISLPVTHPIFQIDLEDLEGANLEDKVNFIDTVVQCIEKNDLSNLSNLNLQVPGEDEYINEKKRKLLHSILSQMDVTYLTHVGFWGGRKRSNKPPESDDEDERNEAELVSLLDPANDGSSDDESFLLQNKQSILMDDKDLLMPQKEPICGGFFSRLGDYLEWQDQSLPGKVQMALYMPVLLLQHATIHWAEEDKYFRWFYVLQPPFITMFIFTSYGLWGKEIVIGDTHVGNVVYWVLPIAILLSVLIFFTTKEERKPVYEPVFVFLGLGMSVVWISTIADQLVAILSVLGHVFNIPAGIMGLTVLAWGNSISDFVSNISVARKGFPEMAIAASYSAPLTNLLLGLGLALTMKILKEGPIQLKVSTVAVERPDLTNTIYLSFCFLLGSLLITLVAVPASRFTYRRPFGIALVGIYVSVLIISVLALNGVILHGTNLWML